LASSGNESEDVDEEGRSLTEFLIAAVAFLTIAGAACLGFLASAGTRSLLPDKTGEVVRLVANLFVVMTSLILGLMLNSAKNTLEMNNRNIHALATQLILLDRTLRALGPEAEPVRRGLTEYVQTSLREANILEEDPRAEAALDAAGAALRAIKGTDEQNIALWNDASQLYRQAVQQRWVLVDASGGTIPRPLIVMLILWLAVIFASFGYRAPRSAVVAVSILLAAALVSGALYLIFDMDTPASGLIQTSNVPFQRALAQLQR
jgi:hypothetical protein